MPTTAWESIQRKIHPQQSIDPLSLDYYASLYAQYESVIDKKPVRIHEEGKAPENGPVAYSTAQAPAKILEQFPGVDYSTIRASPKNYSVFAKQVSLWAQPMEAGTGSSIVRRKYLSSRTGVPEHQIRLGAKGTDLFVDFPQESGSASIAELQILRLIRSQEKGEFSQIFFQDIVGPETQESVRKIWEKPSLLDPSLTYSDWVEKTRGLRRFGETFQPYMPTFTEAGELSYNRVSPAGHACFAVNALRAVLQPELRPQAPYLICAISNGEDLGSSIDPWIAGWMLEEHIPIALVATEKTEADIKGGILGLVEQPGEGVYLQVIETAQAKENGQLALFESLPGLCSTNLSLFNYDVLEKKLGALRNEIGPEKFDREFRQAISPDLIRNWKEQEDSDGIRRKYLQLEGAMGSTLMNLDRYWRKTRGGEPLVHIVQVSRKDRTEFFTPIKSAFDFKLLCNSDRFRWNAETLRFENLRPGTLPKVSLSDLSHGDQFYKEVQNVLDAFEGASLLELDELEVSGQIFFRGVKLSGRVSVRSEASVPLQIPGKELRNMQVRISADGKVHTSTFSDPARS